MTTPYCGYQSLIMPERFREGARQILRTALAAEDIAKMRLQAAIDAVGRAKMFLTQMEDDLRGFADVDQKLTAYRADKIKEWSVSGGERPSLDLPADLAAAREAKMGAEECVAAARVAFEGLTDELQTAKEARQRAEEEVRNAAVEVMRCEAEGVIDELETVQARMRALQSWLLDFAGFALSDGESTPQIHLSSRALSIIQDIKSKHDPMVESVRRDSTAALRAWYAALLENSEAKFDDASGDGVHGCC
jgi:hypothetical protein